MSGAQRSNGIKPAGSMHVYIVPYLRIGRQRFYLMSHNKALNSLGMLGGRMSETLLQMACKSPRERRATIVQEAESKCRAVLGDALMRKIGKALQPEELVKCAPYRCSLVYYDPDVEGQLFPEEDHFSSEEAPPGCGTCECYCAVFFVDVTSPLLRAAGVDAKDRGTVAVSKLIEDFKSVSKGRNEAVRLVDCAEVVNNCTKGKYQREHIPIRGDVCDHIMKGCEASLKMATGGQDNIASAKILDGFTKVKCKGQQDSWEPSWDPWPRELDIDAYRRACQKARPGNACQARLGKGVKVGAASSGRPNMNTNGSRNGPRNVPCKTCNVNRYLGGYSTPAISPRNQSGPQNVTWHERMTTAGTLVSGVAVSYMERGVITADMIHHRVYLAAQVCRDGAESYLLYIQANGCNDISYPGGDATVELGMSAEEIETRLAEDVLRELREEVGYIFAGNAFLGQGPPFDVGDLKNAEKKVFDGYHKGKPTRRTFYFLDVSPHYQREADHQCDAKVCERIEAHANDKYLARSSDQRREIARVFVKSVNEVKKGGIWEHHHGAWEAIKSQDVNFTLVPVKPLGTGLQQPTWIQQLCRDPWAAMDGTNVIEVMRQLVGRKSGELMLCSLTLMLDDKLDIAEVNKETEKAVQNIIRYVPVTVEYIQHHLAKVQQVPCEYDAPWLTRAVVQAVAIIILKAHGEWADSTLSQIEGTAAANEGKISGWRWRP